MTLNEFCKSVSIPMSNKYYHGHFREYGKRFITKVVEKSGNEIDCSIFLEGDNGITDVPLSEIFKEYSNDISHVIITADKDLAPDIHHEGFNNYRFVEEVEIKMYMDGR